MTVRELGDFIIWAGAVIGALFAIGAVLRVAVVTPLKRHVVSEVQEVTVKLGILNQRFTDHLMSHRDRTETKPLPNCDH